MRNPSDVSEEIKNIITNYWNEHNDNIMMYQEEIRTEIEWVLSDWKTEIEGLDYTMQTR